MTDECVRKKTEIDDDSCKKFVLSYEAYFSKCTLSVDAKRLFFQIWPWTTCGFSMMEPWNTNSTPNQISRSSFHSEVAIAISRSNSIRFFFVRGYTKEQTNCDARAKRKHQTYSAEIEAHLIRRWRAFGRLHWYQWNTIFFSIFCVSLRQILIIKRFF